MPVGGYKDLDLSKRLKTLSFPVMKFLELRTKVGNRKGGINYRWKRCGKAQRGTLGDFLRGPILPSGYGAAIQEGSQIGEMFGGEVTEEGRREKVGHPFFQPMKTFLFF
ncbi:hypothetical protein HanPSC8_Chr09g0369211 [Helianthus annuus]|nr:hypothetical protein HanPSC8_Chr09g0369211 [Helianthus annuus]